MLSPFHSTMARSRNLNSASCNVLDRDLCALLKDKLYHHAGFLDLVLLTMDLSQRFGGPLDLLQIFNALLASD